MNYFTIYLWTSLIILGFVTTIWIISLIKRDASIIDIFWGTGFIVAGGFYFLQSLGDAQRRIFMLILIAIWGLRLSLYLAWRNLGKPEDYRYQVWRRNHGEKWWWRSFFRVFLLQGLVMWVVSAPLLSAQINARPLEWNIFDCLGVVFFAMGLFFETAGDWQLARFKGNSENKDKVLNHGVWYYTRHPNYFGDAMIWWSFYLFACGNGNYWCIASPIIMNFFLVKISGVKLLEKNLVKTKPQYEEYVKTTSAFIPWFKRR